MHPSDNLLVQRLEAAATDYLLQRYGGPGNPMGTEVRRIGGAVATKVSFAPGNPQMNTIHLLSDPASLQPFLDFYRETGQDCWIDLSPARANADLARAMIEAGFRPEGYRALLHAGVAELPRDRRAGDDIRVRPVEADELDVFLDTMNRGFGLPDAALPTLRRNQSFWTDIPNWRLYLGLLDGEPAGAAVLSVHETDGERIGYLAAGATLARARSHGMHHALLAARLADAVSLDCDRIAGQADFGSVSQRNQQRAGLGLCSVVTVWSNRDSTDRAKPRPPTVADSPTLP